MKNRILVVIAATGFAFSVMAQHDINSVVRRIVDANAAIHATAERYKSQIESERAQNLLAGPEAEFEYKFAPSNVENRWGVSVSQSFDWPGVYRARSRAAKAGERAYTNLLLSEKVTAAVEIKSLIMQYVAAKKKETLLNEAVRNMDSLYCYLQKAYENQSTTILNLRKTQREVYSLQAAAIDAGDAVVRLEANLRAMGDGTAPFIGIDTFGEDQLAEYAFYSAQLQAVDPMVAAYFDLKAGAQARVSVEKLSRMPSFSAGYVHDVEEGIHFNGFSVGIGLPAWGKNRAKSAALADVLANEYAADDYLQGVQATLMADWQLADKLKAKLEPIKKDFDNDNYLDLLSKSFYGGQLTVFDYLRELNDYVSFKIEIVDLQQQYASVLTRLNRYSILTDGDN